MIRFVLIAALGSLVPAQDRDPMFSVRESDGVVVVSANRAAVACDAALDELGGALGWSVRYPAGDLRDRLTREVVDLSLTDRAPRLVASLIASVAGADAVLVERDGELRPRVEIVVVDVPDASNEAGRRRLRDWALDRYRDCLAERARDGRDGDTEALRVRMHMAELLARRGEFGDAAILLEQVYALAPDHQFVPQALLRMARCWFELGPDTWIEAERRARDLIRTYPARPEGAQGAVLLGRILLAAGRAAECAANLERSYLLLADTPEIVDVYLLVALARYHLGDAEAVARVLATLEGGHDVVRLDSSQRAEHLFLTGYAALERGMPRRASRAFEQWFVTADESDPLRGEAFVFLGEAYFEDGRYLQARAAAVHARRHASDLDRATARRSAQLLASTALALGDEEHGLRELEMEVRRDPSADGELTLFLAELFLDRGRYSRCADLLQPLHPRSDALGDRARFLTLVALHEQAKGTERYETFVEKGVPLAATLVDAERQRRAATMLGGAFEMLGDVERAADAYRGVLR